MMRQAKNQTTCPTSDKRVVNAYKTASISPLEGRDLMISPEQEALSETRKLLKSGRTKTRAKTSPSMASDEILSGVGIWMRLNA
jgi:hypothetical protein